MVTTRADPLDLGPELLARLDRLSIGTRRAVIGQGAGKRRSPRPGTSIEFADFRTYVPGDDFRRVDWNAYGRLDRLLLKLYLGEEDLSLNLFVDVSGSMDWGEPAKSTTARRIAGALAYIGLVTYDRVSVAGFSAGLGGRLRPQRGRAAAPRIWRFIADLGAGGETDYDSLRRMGRPPRGVSVVISDFLTESDPAPAIAALRQAGQEVALIQVLAPGELNPEVAGDIALRDVETAAIVEVTVTPALKADYAAALDALTRRLSALGAAHGATYQLVSSAEPLDSILLGDMRRSGLLRQ
jgi:uncharacterized protein (DUF58 family)